MMEWRALALAGAVVSACLIAYDLQNLKDLHTRKRAYVSIAIAAAVLWLSLFGLTLTF